MWADALALSARVYVIQAIFQVRKLSMALREMPLHSFTPKYLYRLDEFCDLQKEQGNRVKQAIESFWEADLESSEKACQETLEHLEAKLFGGGSAAQGSGEGAAGGSWEGGRGRREWGGREGEGMEEGEGREGGSREGRRESGGLGSRKVGREEMREGGVEGKREN